MSAYTKAQLDAVKLPGFLDPVRKPGRGVIHLKTQTVDFDALATSSGVALGTTDTFETIVIEPGEVVIAAGIRNDVASTAGAAMDLGDGTTANYFVDGQLINDVSGAYSKTGGYLMGDLGVPSSDSARTLKLTGSVASPAAGIVTVWALVARI
jgi:hypothetical protein